MEQARAVLQSRLDAAKTQAERNRMGQFATPPALAGEILEAALVLLPHGESIRFLEPGFGTGSFYSALLRTAPAMRLAEAEGFEVDPHYGAEAAQLWRGTPLTLHQADFLTAEPPAGGGCFNLLVSNPPYIRHHHIAPDRKPALHRLAKQRANVKLSGLAGLYCYFLAVAHAWMSDGGIGVWLVPSEFMDVNYGRPLKEYLLREVTLLRIHRFDPHDPQFDDALVSSAVVILKKERPMPGHSVEFTFGGTLSVPNLRKDVPASQLVGEKKWTRFPSNGKREESRFVFSDFFTIKRGIATGGNAFFVLPIEEIERRQLPRQFFRPILPGPRMLGREVVEADGDGAPTLERNLFLLDCSLPEIEIRSRYPSLADYLAEGVRDGYRDRYLCSRRTPWYSQETRMPPPFLCTYIGRTNTKSGRPFRFIQNNSRAIASNVYLMLYAKPDMQAFLESDPCAKAAVWHVLNEIPLQSLVLEGRVYGGGLHKLEPKELADVNADELAELVYGKTKPARQSQARQAELAL